MIQVTAINRDKHDVITVSNADAESAAKIAVSLTSFPYLRIVDGTWTLVYPGRCLVSRERLAHIIETHADVVLA